jgi:predicted Fe-S protein YdhL (DUF1289 family)
MTTQERNDFLNTIPPLTERQQAAQLLLTMCVLDGRDNTVHCRAETRRLLESVRDGTATDGERKRVLQAIQRMSKEREARVNSAYARQTYALTLKYLTPERLSAREIARLADVNGRTAHRDISMAIERLAARLFGVAALEWQ